MKTETNEPEVVISTEVPEEIYKQFLALCSAADMDPSEVIRDIVKHWVYEQEEAIGEFYPELSSTEIKKTIKNYLFHIRDPKLLEDVDNIPVRFIYNSGTVNRYNVLGCMFHGNVTASEISQLLNITESTLANWIYESLTEERFYIVMFAIEFLRCRKREDRDSFGCIDVIASMMITKMLTSEQCSVLADKD